MGKKDTSKQKTTRFFSGLDEFVRQDCHGKNRSKLIASINIGE